MAILFILVIFPLKFPLNPKNFTANGKKCPTAKTKTVLESVNETEQLVRMSKSKREKIQNKNHPTLQTLENRRGCVIAEAAQEGVWCPARQTPSPTLVGCVRDDILEE